MNGSEAFACVEMIYGVNGNNDKLELLAEFGEDDFFRQILNLAYNPFIRFHLTSKQVRVKEYGDHLFDNYDVNLLMNLQKRTVSGNDAIFMVQERLRLLDKENQELFCRILDKDLKFNAGLTMINKACPGLLPKVCYMRCSLLKDVPKFDWQGAIVQEKMDGMFMNASKMNEQIQFTTRKGQQLPPFPNITGELLEAMEDNTQLHGEVLVVKKEKYLDRKTANGILNSALKMGEFPSGYTFVYFVWDVITYHDILNRKSPTPYHKRLSTLNRILRGKSFVHVLPSYTVLNKRGAMEIFEMFLERGKEGAVAKEKNGVWRDGTSKQQVKLKGERDCDLVVTGFHPGTGKNEKTFGSLICESADGLLEVKVSGFTDEEREKIWEEKEETIGKVITVRFNEVITSLKSKKASLFLPRFVEFRTDTEADELDKIIKS
jgi:DNA ligase-1